MTTTTNYFKSFTKAVRYYDKYMFNNTISIVKNKINIGEIVIGKPSIKENETLIIDKDGRYSISTKGD